MESRPPHEPDPDPGERIRELEREVAALSETKRELQQRLDERSQLYRLVRHVAAITSTSDSVADMLHLTLRALCERGEWTLAHFYYYDAPTATLLPSSVWEPDEKPGYDELRATSWTTHFAPGECAVGAVFETRESQETLDLDVALGSSRRGHRASGLRRVLFVPVVVADSNFGVLELFSADPTPALRQTVRTMELIGEEIAQAIVRKQTESLSAQLEAKEQHRIGRELHDGLGQLVSGIGMLAHDLHRRLVGRDAPEARDAAELLSSVEAAKLELRGLVRGLMPVYSGAEGLEEALGRLCDETQAASGIECRFEADIDEELRDHFAARHLFYIAQEALRNAASHADAGRIDVRLEQRDRRVVLSVRDDGIGLPGGGATGGSGLRIMRHRAALMAARLVVESQPGAGTLVSCRIRIGGAFRRQSNDR